MGKIGEQDKLDSPVKQKGKEKDLVHQLSKKIDINKRARNKPSIYKYTDYYNKHTLDDVANTFKNNIEYQKRLK